LLTAATTLSAVGAELKLMPGSKEDYGSGSVALSRYWPGGVDGMGCVAGHANHLTRKDRVLLRFNLGRLYLLPRLPQIKSAVLRICLYWDSSPEIKRFLTISALNYEPEELSVFDLSNPDVFKTGVFPVRLQKMPSQGTDGLITVDVTRLVNRALKEKQLYIGFRIADSAEDIENKTGKHICTIIQTPSVNSGRNPVLDIKY